MGQDLTADFTVSSEPKFCDPLPSFRIYAEHYLICWSIGREVCVCGGGGGFKTKYAGAVTTACRMGVEPRSLRGPLS